MYIHLQGRKRAAEQAASSHVDHGPRRPRPERLRRAPTTSTTRPRRKDDRHKERRYDNRDHHHNRPKSTRTGQLYRHRPDFYPKINTLLIFIFNIIFITTFLHNVLVMIILQITFVHVYNLKYNIQLYLMQILDQSCWRSMPPETALSPASPYTCTSVCPLCYGWSAAAP